MKRTLENFIDTVKMDHTQRVAPLTGYAFDRVLELVKAFEELQRLTEREEYLVKVGGRWHVAHPGAVTVQEGDEKVLRLCWCERGGEVVGLENEVDEARYLPE